VVSNSSVVRGTVIGIIDPPTFRSETRRRASIDELAGRLQPAATSTSETAI
jgi:hypothetical protein